MLPAAFRRCAGLHTTPIDRAATPLPCAADAPPAPQPTDTSSDGSKGATAAPEVTAEAASGEEADLAARAEAMAQLQERMAQLQELQEQKRQLEATRAYLASRMAQMEAASQAHEGPQADAATGTTAPAGGSAGEAPEFGGSGEGDEGEGGEGGEGEEDISPDELAQAISMAQVVDLLQSFGLDVSETSDMEEQDMRQLLALLVHRHRLQERLQRRAELLQSLEALQGEDGEAGVVPDAPQPAPAGAPDEEGDSADKGSGEGDEEEDAGPPEDLDVETIGKLAGFSDRLTRLLALHDALVSQGDDGAAQPSAEGGPSAEQFLQTYMGQQDGAEGGADGEAGEEAMSAEDLQQLRSMHQQLLDMQAQRAALQQRLTDLHSLRDNLSQQLEAAEAADVPPHLVKPAGTGDLDTVPELPEEAPSAGTPGAEGAGDEAASEDSAQYTEDFEEDSSPTAPQPNPQASQEGGEEDEAMLAQLSTMNGRLDSVMAAMAQASEQAEAGDLSGLAQVVAPLLAAGGLSQEDLVGGAGQDSGALAAALTKALFGDLPMGQFLAQELQQGQAERGSPGQATTQPAQSQGDAGASRPPHASPRPSTSRKVANPSPDVFHDYVSRTGHIPDAFQPDVAGDSADTHSPVAGEEGHVGVLSIHDTGRDQGVAEVLTLDSDAAKAARKGSAAGEEGHLTPQKAAEDARVAARAAQAAAEQASAAALAAASLLQNRAADTTEDSGTESSSAWEDGASTISADTASIMQQYLSDVAAALATVPKSVLKTSAFRKDLRKATRGAASAGVTRARVGKRVRARPPAAPTGSDLPFGKPPRFVPPGFDSDTAPLSAGEAVNGSLEVPPDTVVRRATRKRNKAKASTSGQRGSVRKGKAKGKPHVGGVRRPRGATGRKGLVSRRAAAEPTTVHRHKRRATATGGSKSGVKRRGVGGAGKVPSPEPADLPWQVDGSDASSTPSTPRGRDGAPAEAQPLGSPGPGWTQRSVHTGPEGGVRVHVSGPAPSDMEQAMSKVKGVKQQLAGMRARPSPHRGGRAAAQSPRGPPGALASGPSSPVVAMGRTVAAGVHDYEIDEHAIRSDPTVEGGAEWPAEGFAPNSSRVSTDSESVATPLTDFSEADSAVGSEVEDGEGGDWLAVDRPSAREVRYIRHAPRLDAQGRGGLPIPVLVTASGGIAFPPPAPPGMSTQRGGVAASPTSSSAAPVNIWASDAPKASEPDSPGWDFHGRQLQSKTHTPGAAGAREGRDERQRQAEEEEEEEGSWTWSAPVGGDEAAGGGEESPIPLPDAFPGAVPTERVLHAPGSDGHWQAHEDDFDATPPLPDDGESVGSWDNDIDSQATGSVAAWDSAAAGGEVGHDAADSGVVVGQEVRVPRWSRQALQHGRRRRRGSGSAQALYDCADEDIEEEEEGWEAVARAAPAAQHWAAVWGRSSHQAARADSSLDLASSSAGGDSSSDCGGLSYEGASDSGTGSDADSEEGESEGTVEGGVAYVPPRASSDSEQGSPAREELGLAVPGSESVAVPLSSVSNTPQSGRRGGGSGLALDVHTPSRQAAEAAAAARAAGQLPLPGIASGLVSPPVPVRGAGKGHASLPGTPHSISMSLSPDASHPASPADHADMVGHGHVREGQALAGQVPARGSGHSTDHKSYFSVHSKGASSPGASSGAEVSSQASLDELKGTLEVLRSMRMDSESAEKYIRSPDFGRGGSKPPAAGFAPSPPVTKRYVMQQVRSSGTEGAPRFQLVQQLDRDAEAAGGDAAGSSNSDDSDSTASDGSSGPSVRQSTKLPVPVNVVSALGSVGTVVDQTAHLNRALLLRAVTGHSAKQAAMLAAAQGGSDSSDTE